MSLLRRTILGITAWLALFALTSCSERSDLTGVGANTVQVQDNSFSPTAKTVTVGTTVRWTWNGANQHTVTFGDGPTSVVQTTGSYERTFTVAGTYNYLCGVHGASMSGTITVP